MAVAIQLVVLYWPSTGVGTGVPGLDKVVHVAVFGAVAVTAVRAGARPRLVLAVLVAHAAVSEAVQAMLLPGRSGDLLDVVADVAGAVAGVCVAVARRRPARR